MQSASPPSCLLVTVPQVCTSSSAVPRIEFHVCSCLRRRCFDSIPFSWQGLGLRRPSGGNSMSLRSHSCRSVLPLHPASLAMVLHGCVLPHHALCPNTLGLAAAACFAPPASTMPTVPLSGAGVAPVGAGIPFRSRVSKFCGFDISHLDVRDYACLLKAVKVLGAAGKDS